MIRVNRVLLVFIVGAAVAAGAQDKKETKVCVTIERNNLTAYGKQLPDDRLRDQVAKFITGKGIKGVPIANQQTPTNGAAEARERGCDYLLKFAVGNHAEYQLQAISADEPLIQGEYGISGPNSVNDILIPTERAAGTALDKMKKRAAGKK